jgi:hypothetical protein
MKDPEAWPWWVYLVRDVGFPIFIAVYLLWRVELSVDELAQHINRLAVEVAKLGARCSGTSLL